MEEDDVDYTKSESTLLEDERNADFSSMDLHFKSKYVTLLEEKSKMEADFSVQRAKLKELYLQKEAELRVKCEENEANALESTELTKKLCQLQHELEEARSQVTITQCTAENEISIEKRKCQEEIASIQQILHENIQELRSQLQLSEQEKINYRDLYERCFEDSFAKKEGSYSSGVLSAVTKSLAKRVPSLSPAHSNLSPLVEKSGRTSPGSVASLNSTSASLGTGAGMETPESLEDSMRRAQDDAAVLRSLVEPLEEEIRALKDKIRAQDNRLQEYEGPYKNSGTCPGLVPSTPGKSADELVQELDEKLKGVKTTLEAEKESRADLELYTSLLNSQKGILTNSVDVMKAQLIQMSHLYENEKKEHLELKSAWQRTNDQFLQTQRMHLSDLRKIGEIFTADQLRKFHELQKQDESRVEEPKNCPKSSPIAYYGRMSPVEEGHSSSSPQEGPSEDPEGAQHAGSSEDTASSLLDSSEDTTSESTPNTDDGVIGRISKEELLSKYPPEVMPQLTDDQKKALFEIGDQPAPLSFYVEGEGRSTPNENVVVQEPLEPSAEHRLVSEAEWKKVQDELKESRLKMTEGFTLCAQFEVDLKKAQSEAKELEKKRDLLSKANERLVEELANETSYRKGAEAQWKQKSEQYDKQEKDLRSNVEKLTTKYSQVVAWSKRKYSDMDKKLADFVEFRTRAHAEMTRLQKENDSLVGKHSQHSIHMQNEVINLPDTMEGMQLLLLQYREELIAAKVAKESAEEKLSSEVAFLKDQMMKEQNEWGAMESTLNEQNDELRRRLNSLERKSEDLESERKTRQETQDRLTAMEGRAKESSQQSEELIEAMKTQLEEMRSTKVRQEREILELKTKLSTLQHDLKTSEDVQRDFVRLSQTLQVQLEDIRQSEKEVRWQHEDDVDDCSNCKQRFSGVGRRKGHCRHCGKLFCSECLSKTVRSGPKNRSSRVCDVCHTLLVQDATPFFSKEPPHSPD